MRGKTNPSRGNTSKQHMWFAAENRLIISYEEGLQHYRMNIDYNTTNVNTGTVSLNLSV